MIPNQFLYRATISDLEAAILIGVKKYGRRKTITEILEEAHMYADARERVQIAFALEEAGYIKSVSYQLPVTIRAELSPTGEKIAESLEDERWLGTREMRKKVFH